MNVFSRWFRRSPAEIVWIEPAELAPRLGQGGAPLVLDVRGPDEFTGPLGHIAEARNLPLGDLAAQLPELVRDGRPIVTVCKTDRRSATAAEQLREAGASDVRVLRGGMERWCSLDLPRAELP
jgi:rhodanese-related sulfurtransferase